jgi:hypothetical protein
MSHKLVRSNSRGSAIGFAREKKNKPAFRWGIQFWQLWRFQRFWQSLSSLYRFAGSAARR